VKALPTAWVSAKQRSRAAFVQVIEEDAADAARLVAVLEEKVLVAPLLVLRMHLVAERRQRALQV
jgi:hypothetical protein